METQNTDTNNQPVQMAGGIPPEEQKAATIMNIAVILFFFISPLVGFLIASKEQTFLKEQSRLALNGTITYTLFLVASFVLNITVILSFIGIPLLIAAFICTLYGGIKGAVESSHGRLYAYPLSLNLVH